MDVALVTLLSDDYIRLAPAAITAMRDTRQRRSVNTAGLRESIALRGIINPLIVTREHVLVAGERRLQCAIELGLPTVPVRYIDTLDETELQIVELEENLRRADLTWQDQALAVLSIHELYVARDGAWLQKSTGEALGLSEAAVSTYLRVARELSEGRLTNANGIRAAVNFVQRSDERKAIAAVEELVNATTSAMRPATEPKAPQKPPAVLCEDFLTWAPAYTGQRFNLIHCDFPFGIKVFSGKQGSLAGVDNPGYDDGRDIYDALIETLCVNLDRLMSPSGHIMFWCSMSQYIRTLIAFRKLAPSLIFSQFPLIWVKSDNTGIVPDPKRGPRRIYETAIFASREDRPIVKIIANAYLAPTDKSIHPHCKPEPVLRHFFQLFCDSSTRLLDPTCGSGSALRAAESLGAARVLGLEIDRNFASMATEEMRRFRMHRTEL